MAHVLKVYFLSDLKSTNCIIKFKIMRILFLNQGLVIIWHKKDKIIYTDF